MMKVKRVKEFYNDLSEEYTQLILRCVPRYDEMQQQLFKYISDKSSIGNILELGCGSGILSVKIREHFPKAKLQLVDISNQILEECKINMGDSANCTFINKDFSEVDFEENSFDFVTSCISIHHLPHEEKSLLFKKIYKWLKPGGQFIYSDQTKGLNNEIYQKHIEIWQAESRAMGASEKEWNDWMDHQSQHDFHATYSQQIKWLKDAKFKDVDVLWRYLLWTVFYSRK